MQQWVDFTIKIDRNDPANNTANISSVATKSSIYAGNSAILFKENPVDPKKPHPYLLVLHTRVSSLQRNAIKLPVFLIMWVSSNDNPSAA